MYEVPSISWCTSIFLRVTIVEFLCSMSEGQIDTLKSINEHFIRQVSSHFGLYYIYNRDLSLDLNILFETIFVVLGKRGAY